MADTYRPLTAEDPVGTEVYHVDDKDNDMARKIVHIDGDKTWTRWRGVDVVHPTAKLRVRVPDPWGELLEAAKEVNEFSSLVTVWDRLRAAIAAVEAAKKGASDVPWERESGRQEVVGASRPVL